MNQNARLLSALVIVAVGLAVWLWPDDAAKPAPQPPPDQPTSVPSDPIGPMTADVPDPVSDDGGRTEVTQTTQDDAAQGVVGRVLGVNGAPVPGAEVFLVEGQGRDLVTMMRLQQQNIVVPPVARVLTGADGVFQVGVQHLARPRYELVVLHRDHADHRVPNITLEEGRWADVGDQLLESGQVVSGRVTVQGSPGFPVADAEISIQPATMFPTLSPIPGREKGIVVQTDSNGWFRADHVGGVTVHVAAVAAGFALVERQNVVLGDAPEIRVDFELPKGQSIRGVVTTSASEPIAGVTLRATSLSGTTQTRIEARSGSDGRFELIGLGDQSYQLEATAPDYVRRELQRVPAGNDDVRIVLTPKAMARVHVEAPDGRLLTRYTLQPRNAHDLRGSLGPIPGQRRHAITPNDLVDGAYAFPGLDPGRYVFEVHAPGFAMSFSEPFEVEGGSSEPIDVTTVVASGGRMTGVVLDDGGGPLAGATVETFAADFQDSAFAEITQALIVDRVTRIRSRTGPDGRFELERLAAGTYQIRITEPRHTARYETGIGIEDGRRNDLGTIRMSAGTQVRGTAMLDGRPAGQIKITLQRVVDARDPSAVAVHAEAVSANDGSFVVRKRLPPGEYEARAARQTLPTPLLQVVDAQRTRQTFTLTPGQRTQTLQFQLTSN